MSRRSRFSEYAAKLSPGLEGGAAETAVCPTYARVEAPAVFRLTGPDHVEALDRIVSQAIGNMTPGEGRLALVLAPKGQFRGLMAVFRRAGDIVVTAPPGRGDELAAALGKYLAFSRSKLVPIPAPAALLVAGTRWAQSLAVAHDDIAVIARGGVAVLAGRPTALCLGQTFLGVPSAYVVAATASDAAGIEADLAAAGCRAVGTADFELVRLDVGFPAWGAELRDDVLPPEVGLERVAVSYSKGCYVGQETIARLRTYGHPNRLLVRVALRAEGGLPDIPATIVLASDDRRHGLLTSVARHPVRGTIGLALVRREGADPGATWRAPGVVVEVVGSPTF